MTHKEPSLAVTTEEAAHLLSKGKTWLYDQAKWPTPLIPMIKLGKSTRWSRAAIERIVNPSNQTTAT